MKHTTVSVTWPLMSMLGLLFIALKLTGHVTWSWLWVLAPFWLPPALVIGFMLLAFVIAAIIAGSAGGR